MAIADNNLPSIGLIVNVMTRRKASVPAIISKLDDAVAGVYAPRGYTEREVDLATLAFRMGGRNLLYSLNHGSHFPSLRTLRRHASFTRITPCIGPITCAPIVADIREVVLKVWDCPGAVRRGFSVCVDETALEEAAVWFPHSDEVGGMCWKHTPGVDLELRSIPAAEKLATAIHKDEIHMGKELTVIAAAPFGETGIYPLLAVPTCKREDAEDAESVLLLVVATWREHAGHIGDIWSVATDGDATRRAAGYSLLVKHKLSATSALHSSLSNMRGLNLYTGDLEVTLDFDFKHIFKRVSTLIRSQSGIVLNNGRAIMPCHLARYLVHVPGQDSISVQRLLNPDDPQDVPQAIDLMDAIIRLRDVTMDLPDLNTAANLDALRILSHILESILDPFRNVNFTLTQQVASLSKYAHLAMSHFCEHRLLFMSNQLYGDSQTMVKNAMFCIAKQQNLNATLLFYLFDLGDDRLEKLFGRCRMLGGHVSGMNYRQGVDRLGHAVDIDNIHCRHPDLDPGQRRLNMTRSEGADHLNYVSWKGDVIAGHCNLAAAWKDGACAAEEVLAGSQMRREAFAYASIFAKPGVDLLRPFGGDKYPGVETDIDRSIEVDSSNEGASPSQAEDGDDGEEDPIMLEEHIEVIPELALPRGPGVIPDHWLWDPTRRSWVHKSSVTRLIINKDYAAKSKDRQQRARLRVYTKPDIHDADTTPTAMTGEANFLCGDPVLALVRTDGCLSIAVLRTTTIKEAGKPRGFVMSATLQNPKANVVLYGQIMQLHRIIGGASLLPRNPNLSSEARSSPADDAWIWTGGYHTALFGMRGSSEKTSRVSIIEVSGHLTAMVNPDEVTASTFLNDIRQINSEKKTYALTGSQLEFFTELLSNRIKELSTDLSSLPLVTTSSIFLYASANGTPLFRLQEASEKLATQKESTRICHLCGEDTAVIKWRMHIGLHILRAMRGILETLKLPVAESLPCGFCGTSACPPHLKRKKRNGVVMFTVETSCPYEVPIRYGMAAKGSTTTPCCNVPVICDLCVQPANARSTTDQAIWRYNMAEHLSTHHAEYASPNNPEGIPLPLTVWDATSISREEELGVGIPPTHIPGPFTGLASNNEASAVEQEPTGSQPMRKRQKRAL
ncbi:hypothetical protein HGRIS_011861 [Hohenbuehelia grisea]|uniref:Uncharacterized protein n=1 Tax=Hohenbuehelia grisea TaxID=104357 RepID=A0ABR3JYK8_9AGAR